MFIAKVLCGEESIFYAYLETVMNHGQNQLTVHNGGRHLVQVVDLVGDDSVDYWCSIFDAMPSELTDAVTAVGCNPDLVRRYFQVRRRRCA